MGIQRYEAKPGQGMDIRQSPYNSPFTPSEPKGVYWIGLEYKDLPHSAHVYQYNYFELRRRQLAAVAAATAKIRAGFGQCVIPASWRGGLVEEVAEPVTPPLTTTSGNPALKTQPISLGF